MLALLQTTAKFAYLKIIIFKLNNALVLIMFVSAIVIAQKLYNVFNIIINIYCEINVIIY